jgi:ADP-ribosylation factor-like protein 1
VQVWDLGGQSSIRPFWRCYYPNTDAIVFVVDSTDVERLPVAKAALHGLLAEADLKESHLIVFANKQDDPDALKAEDISEALGLSTIKDRHWAIQATSAKEGHGLWDGFDWLVARIKGSSE